MRTPRSIFPARDSAVRSAFSIGFKNSRCSSLRIASISWMSVAAICCFLRPSVRSCSRRWAASCLLWIILRFQLVSALPIDARLAANIRAPTKAWYFDISSSQLLINLSQNITSAKVGVNPAMAASAKSTVVTMLRGDGLVTALPDAHTLTSQLPGHPWARARPRAASR